MHTLLILAALVLSGLVFAGTAYLVARSRARHRAMLATLVSEDHQFARTAWQAAERKAADWQRRAEEYRQLNSSVLDERDKWQRLYWSQASAHGNAQALMMATIETFGRRLAALGQKAEVPAVIHATLAEFTSTHLNTVPQETGTPQISRPEQQGLQVPDTTSTEHVPVKES